jgi:hypothetical protein
MRKASAAESTVSVPTPTRDASIRHGAFTNNILRLEQSAEKMSEGGSDIGEEIRRMNDVDKARSRQNSIQSSHQGDYILGRSAPLQATRSRASSHALSIFDVNGSARSGGYSPGGYITSPVESVRSHGSWSQHRKPSTSSRLAQMVEPVQEGRPLDSPLAPSVASYFPGQSQSMSRQTSQASHASHASNDSFARRYDQIAGEIQNRLDSVPPTPPTDTFPASRPDYDGERETGTREGTATPPGRPRSTDTYQEAQIAFKDFDGVHFSPGTEEFIALDDNGNEVRRVSARNSSGHLSMSAASMLRVPPLARPISYAEPPPDEHMVYYPAPVPRMLNLPKRLSQLPSANVQAKRRTQVLDQLQPDARHSAAWLSQTNFDATSHQRSGSAGSQASQPASRGVLNERMSMANFQNLPPQLRASVFFDHQSVSHNVKIKSESAVATLDNILAASVTAPVSAFTDHPYAGDVSKYAYAPERAAARRSTATLVQRAANTESNPESEKKMRHRSSLAMLLRRNSSADELGAALKRNESRSSLLLDFNEGGRKLQKRKSLLSLSGDMHRPQDVPLPATPADELEFEDGILGHAGSRVASGSRPATAMSGRMSSIKSGKMLSDNELIQRDFAEEEEREDVYDPDAEASFVQPSTLLAELQVRKAQLKSRNRNAVTAYPTGMHSTLLELDAVAGIEQRKRQKQRIALAWEDPNARQKQADADEEDDVPLGVLFPTKNGLANRATGDERDWNRPLGLMEKKQLEDDEPLSSRRNRLRGGPALARNTARRSMVNPIGGHLPSIGAEVALENGAEADEQEGETLGQRLRRLRTKQELDIAISDIAPKDGERPLSTFSADVLSQFDGLDDKRKSTMAGAELSAPDSPARYGPTPENLENETLGQRRARLQAEREANGGTRNISDSAAAETTARPALRSSNSMAHLLTTNPAGPSRRSSAMHAPQPGTLLAKSADEQAKAKWQLHDTNLRGMSYGAAGRPAAVTRNSSMPFSAMPVPQQMPSMPLWPMQQQAPNNFFASPTAMQMGGYGAYNPMANYAQQQQQMQAMYGMPIAAGGYVYPGQAVGYGMPMGMGYGGMGMAEEDMTPQQRAKIDHWRQSVAH